MQLDKVQSGLLAKVKRYLASKSRKPTILAVTTGGGKTEIAIEYIRKHPKKRVLVLTHGQSTLRENFASRLQLRGIPFTLMDGSGALPEVNKSQVTVALPHNVYRYTRKLAKFDLLVVDEAHQFYGTTRSMYNRILKWHGRGKQLLLTASHYGLEGNKVFYSREEALRDGRIRDFPVEFVQVNGEKLKDGDFVSGELRRSVHLTQSTYTVVLEMLNPKLRTMVICNNTKFASTLLSSLHKRGIDARLSTCYNDIDSQNLADFKAGNYKVLLVVARGSVGFDYPELEVVLDATYTRNVIRMEQMVGRLSRGTANKCYIKLVPTEFTSKYLNYLQAVCATGEKETYETWKGTPAALKVQVPTDGQYQDKRRIDTVSVSDFFVNGKYKVQFGHLNSIWDRRGATGRVTLAEAIGKVKRIEFISEIDLRQIIKTGKIPKRIYKYE